jgi:alkanesulfonate monooxygenase SsuD/methylene tetrahydromethanopterin reductase-like flavin-dependent oxidoreductase (luciferase family)
MQREFATVGTSEEVRRQVESFRDAGVEYFITSFERDRELQGVEQFASQVMKHL